MASAAAATAAGRTATARTLRLRLRPAIFDKYFRLYRRVRLRPVDDRKTYGQPLLRLRPRGKNIVGKNTLIHETRREKRRKREERGKKGERRRKKGRKVFFFNKISSFKKFRFQCPAGRSSFYDSYGYGQKCTQLPKTCYGYGQQNQNFYGYGPKFWP